MKNYIQIDGKQIEISDETAKSLKEQFSEKKGWYPDKGDKIELVNEWGGCDDNNDNYMTPLIQKVYPCNSSDYFSDATKANQKLEKYINGMIRKYGWTDDNYYYLDSCDNWCYFSNANSVTLHRQRAGVAMHKDSTQGEREKMKELIIKANEYLTKQK